MASIESLLDDIQDFASRAQRLAREEVEALEEQLEDLNEENTCLKAEIDVLNDTIRSLKDQSQ